MGMLELNEVCILSYEAFRERVKRIIHDKSILFMEVPVFIKDYNTGVRSLKWTYFVLLNQFHETKEEYREELYKKNYMDYFKFIKYQTRKELNMIV